MAFPKTLTSKATSSCVKAFTACLVAASVLLCSETVGSAPADEYQVKAAFLFNFAKFVDWPSDAFSDANAPLVIGVLGQDPFGSYLDDTLHGERVANRQVTLQRYHSVAEIKRCHVLFISRSESGRLSQIVNSLKYRGILTVTDSDVNQSGVIIRFVSEGNRIRFRIDSDAAKAANLVISSRLLRLG